MMFASPLAFLAIVLFLLPSLTAQTSSSTVADNEGNSYKTVRIGNRMWMAENLRATRFRNGDPIPDVTEGARWTYQSAAARCSYENDSTGAQQNGYLYNWYAVSDPRGICPQGWRVPTDADWQQLADALGGNAKAGGKLKSTKQWDYPNAGATNASGFNALPAGIRMFSGSYALKGTGTGFWSSTNGNARLAWVRYLEYGKETVKRTFFGKTSGLSCRCVKEE